MNIIAMQDLDERIEVVQKSTETLFGFMIPAHEWCRDKSQKYYDWHLKSYAREIHWGVATLSFFLTIVMVISSF